MLTNDEIVKIKNSLKELDALRTILLLRMNQVCETLDNENPSPLCIMYMADSAVRLNNAAYSLYMVARGLKGYAIELAQNKTGYTRTYTESDDSTWTIPVEEAAGEEVQPNEPV